MTFGRKRAGNPLLDIKTRLPKDIIDALDAVALEFNITRVSIIRTAVKEFLYQLRRDIFTEEQTKFLRRKLPKTLSLPQQKEDFKNGGSLEKSKR